MRSVRFILLMLLIPLFPASLAPAAGIVEKVCLHCAVVDAEVPACCAAEHIEMDCGSAIPERDCPHQGLCRADQALPDTAVTGAQFQQLMGVRPAGVPLYSTAGPQRYDPDDLRPVLHRSTSPHYILHCSLLI
jgi:hypothetical protein